MSCASSQHGIAQLLTRSQFVFVLRKKNSPQLSFLHLCHHSTMSPMWWLGVKWCLGGQACFSATINCLVHMFMYSCYFITTCEGYRNVWWNKHIIHMQLVGGWVGGWVGGGGGVCVCVCVCVCVLVVVGLVVYASEAHTHTHARTHTHTHTHTHTTARTRTHAHARTHAHRVLMANATL